MGYMTEELESKGAFMCNIDNIKNDKSGFVIGIIKSDNTSHKISDVAKTVAWSMAGKN